MHKREKPTVCKANDHPITRLMQTSWGEPEQVANCNPSRTIWGSRPGDLSWGWNRTKY